MITRRLNVLVLCVSSLLASCSALAPLIGWSNSDAFSSMKQGQVFSSANQFLFDATLDNVEVIIVFDSPELSFDSLARYAGGFGGKSSALSSLQFEMEGSKSSAWVGVEGNSASDLVTSLSFILNVEPEVITGVDGLNSKQKLIRVDLSPATDEDGFSRQDDMISQVMTFVHSLPNPPTYAALYTSSNDNNNNNKNGNDNNNKAGNVQREEEEGGDAHLLLRRSAESVRTTRAATSSRNSSLCNMIVNENTENPYPCMLFCFTSLNVTWRNVSLIRHTRNVVSYQNITNLQFVNGTCSNDSELCGGSTNYSSCVNVMGDRGLDDGSNNTEPINFLFGFRHGMCTNRPEQGGDPNITCGFWTMDLFVDKAQFYRATEEVLIFPQFRVPNTTSYACGDNHYNVFQEPRNHTDEHCTEDAPCSEIEYKFYGLQVQVFGGISWKNSETRIPAFGPAYNCESYFSTASLMGVVATVVLVILLYCAINFLFGLKTMDRFDDPRGPTISVENLH